MTLQSPRPAAARGRAQGSARFRGDVVARLRAAGCVFAEDEADLLLSAARTQRELRGMVALRVDGLPLEHVLGWVRFCGLRLVVSPGVFVPRARTGLLVREAARLAHRAAVRRRPGTRRTTPADLPVVVDLCCGCGAVGAAVAAVAGARGIRLYAVDLDAASVACARRNLRPYRGRVYRGDLLDPLPAALQGRIDVLVANVPYVPTGAIELLPPEARLHEPRLALDGGADGLDVLRRLAPGASRWLAPGGHLLVETGRRQAPVAAGILSGAGLTPRVVHDDDLDATVALGVAGAAGIPARPGANRLSLSRPAGDLLLSPPEGGASTEGCR